MAVPPSGVWRFAEHLPCVTDVLPAVALVMNPRGEVSGYSLNMCGTFKQSLLEIQQYLLPPQPSLVFTARSYGDLSPWRWNPELCGLAWA